MKHLSKISTGIPAAAQLLVPGIGAWVSNLLAALKAGPFDRDPIVVDDDWV